MTWAAATDLDDVSFNQAVDWFAQRVPITDAAFVANVEQARRQAFWMAGVTQAEVIKQVHQSLKSALDKGIPFEQWQKEIGPTLHKAWIGNTPFEGEAARTETVLRNWAQNSYNRARFQQMSEPAIRRIRPFLMFDGVIDSRQSPTCKACNGVVLPADHPWWAAHKPPMHHRCRSGIRSLTRERAERRGITETPPDIGPQEGFGTGEEYKGPSKTQKGAFPKGARPPAPPKRVPVAAPPAPKVPRARPVRAPRRGRPNERFVPGIHAKRLEVGEGVTAEQANAALSVLSPTELKLLQRRPLGTLSFEPTVFAGRTPLNGVYYHFTANLGVSVSRGAHTYGQAWAAGEVWSVSKAAAGAAEALQRTVVHELGHHLHISLGASANQIVHDAFGRALTAGRFITQYSRQNHFEYFAENYAAYRFHRESLRAHDPNGLAMVEAVLRLHGIEP